MSDSAVELSSELYHGHLLRQMHHFREMGSLCDITIQVHFQGELKEFKAHQVVLAASSGYFRKLLLEKDQPVKLFLDTVPSTDFASFLEFVYTARLKFEKVRTWNILEVAKMLECQDLIEACVKLTESEVPEGDNGGVTKTDILSQDMESNQNSQTNKPEDIQLEGDGSQNMPIKSPNVIEKSLSPDRAGKKKEINSEVQTRRLSNRLAGRKVFVDIPKRKRITKVKDIQKTCQTSPTTDALGQMQNEELHQSEVGSKWDPERGDVSEKKTTEDSVDTTDTDDQEASEEDPNDLDFQNNEEEEEDSTRSPSKGRKKKRIGQFKCDECLRSFHYEKSYLKHIKVSHGVLSEVVYRCNVCQHTFANRCNLKIHERHVHSEERQFSCEVCSKAFKRKKDVKRHTLQVHEGGSDRHFCQVCGKALSSKTALILHERTHTGDRPYECTDCGAKFSQSSALKTHRRTHTGEKPFSCDQCDARFTQNHMLAYHKRCHTGEKPYMCESCGKSFASKEYLKHHARTHSGFKPYKCQICDRAFAQRNSLHQHMKTHTGERPYNCNECGKQFTQLNALQRHHRIHTGEKPYMCVLCNRTFTDKSTIRRHTMTHDKDTPWRNYIVVLKGNMESGSKRMKQGHAAEKNEKSVAQGSANTEERSPEKGPVEETATVKAEPINVSGDWSTTGHSAIALVSHAALGSFTVIQTEVHGPQLEPVVNADPMSHPVTVSIPLPVSLSVPVSAPPLSVPVSVPLSVCTPVPTEMCVTVQSSELELEPEAELELEQVPEPVAEPQSESGPEPVLEPYQTSSMDTVSIPAVDSHLGATEDISVENMSVEMEVSSENVTDATV
ncbi:GDNF-inducible zinc finger protein 1 [Scleropages formosus]|nr:GDNF-inducible zinc finger protein 1 [Scleropages formosus]